MLRRRKPVNQKDAIILRQQLIKHEAYRQHAYTDSLGYWTIGIGRCIHEGKGKGISREEAEYLLDNDIREAREMLEHCAWYRNLDSVRQATIVNMCFNLGFDGLLEFKKMISAIKKKNWGLASKEMLDSEWRHQVGNRAVELSEQMRTGVFFIN
jgi:lysozyme